MNLLTSIHAVGVVSLLHVRHTEHEGEEEAQGSNGDVTNGQEVVLSTEGIGGGEHETLGALEGFNLVVVIDPKLVASWLQSIFDSSPKLSEVGKTSGSHPNNEVL